MLASRRFGGHTFAQHGVPDMALRSLYSSLVSLMLEAAIYDW